jgi:hypothetical protein
VTNVPVAHWSFYNNDDPYLSRVGGYRLRVENGPAPTQAPGGLRFKAGANLYIPRAEIGELDMAASQEATVIVYAKRPAPADNLAFLAGIWDEAGADRQYGLFHNVPLAGGRNGPYMHVSRWGGKTPGWKYSVDGASTLRDTTLADQIHMLGGTYDGAKVRAYLDGITDYSPNVTIKQTSPSKQWTCNRNPFDYPHGLNLNSNAPFRVNAASAKGTPTQHARDMTIRRVLVFKRALNPAEIFDLHHAFAEGTA